MVKKQRIWFVITKDKKPLMFANDEPTKDDNGKWNGQYYVNSQLYNTIIDVISNSKMDENTEPQCLVIDVPVSNTKEVDTERIFLAVDTESGTIRAFKKEEKLKEIVTDSNGKIIPYICDVE